MTKQIEQSMPGLTFSISPRSLKVTLDGESKEREAILVVRDSVGVAFLQILDLGDQKLPSLDLSKGGDGPRLGQDLIGVSRLGRGFDHAPEALRLSVSEAIVSPRKMWGVRGDFHEHGLPAFDLAGLPVGLLLIQFGSEGLDASEMMMGGGMPARPCLLPLETIRPLLEQAKKRVPEAIQKAKAAKDAAPTTDGAAMGDAAMDDAAMDDAGMDGAPPEKEPAPPK